MTKCTNRLYWFCQSGGQKEVYSSLAHIPTSVPAEKTLLSDSSNNELFFINWAVVVGRRNPKSPTCAKPVRYKPVRKRASYLTFNIQKNAPRQPTLRKIKRVAKPRCKPTHNCSTTIQSLVRQKCLNLKNINLKSWMDE